jgi:hypothetical protein
MSIKLVCALAGRFHKKHYSSGSGVSEQTKKAQRVCREWQQRVLKEFPSARFEKEVSLDGRGARQKIDLVDWVTRTAYELKVSPNNIHMEVYKDVFKALVYNKRNPHKKLRRLVFIAPAAGIDRLGSEFPKDVAAITRGLKLKFSLAKI